MCMYPVPAFPPPTPKILINFSFESGKNQLSRLLSLGNKKTKIKQVLLDKMKFRVHLIEIANSQYISLSGFLLYTVS